MRLMVDATRLAQTNLRLDPSEVERLDAQASRFAVDRSSALRFALLHLERTAAKLSAADRLAVTGRRRSGPVKRPASGA